VVQVEQLVQCECVCVSGLQTVTFELDGLTCWFTLTLSRWGPSSFTVTGAKFR